MALFSLELLLCDIQKNNLFRVLSDLVITLDTCILTLHSIYQLFTCKTEIVSKHSKFTNLLYQAAISKMKCQFKSLWQGSVKKKLKMSQWSPQFSVLPVLLCCCLEGVSYASLFRPTQSVAQAHLLWTCCLYFLWGWSFHCWFQSSKHAFCILPYCFDGS